MGESANEKGSGKKSVARALMFVCWIQSVELLEIVTLVAGIEIGVC